MEPPGGITRLQTFAVCTSASVTLRQVTIRRVIHLVGGNPVIGTGVGWWDEVDFDLNLHADERLAARVRAIRLALGSTELDSLRSTLRTVRSVAMENAYA